MTNHLSSNKKSIIMIKINVHPEKFINCPPPEVTEEMIDWILLTLWVHRPEYLYKSIESVNIRANQSYQGSGKIHFYIKIGGVLKENAEETEFHREFLIGTPLYRQHPQLGHDFYKEDGTSAYGSTWNDEPIGRWYWMQYFILKGVDMGEEGIELQKKLDELKAKQKINDHIKKEKEIEENEYRTYLRLHEKFKNRKA